MSYENKAGNVISNETFDKLKEPLRSRYTKSDKKVPTKNKVEKPKEVSSKK